MRWLLVAATLVTLALSAALAVRLLGKRPESVESPVDATAPCAEATRTFEAPRAELALAPLLIELEPGVSLLLDGAPAGDGLGEGRHALVASAPGATPAKLELQVERFTPVLLDARVSQGAVTVLVVGARCVSCVNTGTNPALQFDPSVLSDLPAVASALSTGDWVTASKAMRGIPPTERERPEVIRLLAVLSALAGRPSLARAELELLPETDAARKALVRRDALEELKPARQLKAATARWNATTERFQRLTDRFVTEASGPLMALSQRFDGLSKRFAEAFEAKDAIGCEAALEEANTAMVELVRTLRAVKPADCEWQRRVSDAL